MDARTALPLPDTCDTAPRAEFLRGLRAAVPVMIGFIPFALVLGAQAAQKGLSALEVPLMTGLNFAGGSEFAAVELWTSPPHIALIVAITALVNSRHLLMGASLAPLLQHLPRRRVLPALFFMCDESWAMGVADARRRALGFSLAYYLAYRQACTRSGWPAPRSARSLARCWATSTPTASTWPSPPCSGAAAWHVAGHEGRAAVAGQPGCSRCYLPAGAVRGTWPAAHGRRPQRLLAEDAA